MKKMYILDESRQRNQWVSPKCGCNAFEQDQFQATGGAFAKAFDVQNKKFIVISCRSCGFSELYKAKSSTVGNVADFIFGQ